MSMSIRASVSVSVRAPAPVAMSLSLWLGRCGPLCRAPCRAAAAAWPRRCCAVVPASAAPGVSGPAPVSSDTGRRGGEASAGATAPSAEGWAAGESTAGEATVGARTTAPGTADAGTSALGTTGAGPTAPDTTRARPPAPDTADSDTADSDTAGAGAHSTGAVRSSSASRRVLCSRASFVACRAASPCRRASANSALARARSSRHRWRSARATAKRAVQSIDSNDATEPEPGASKEKHGLGTRRLPPVGAAPPFSRQPNTPSSTITRSDRTSTATR